MRKSAVIFDLDGVICSTDVYHYQAWKAIADRLHIQFDEEMNHKLRGVSRKESFEIILRENNCELSEEEKEKYLEEKNECYKKLLSSMTTKDLSLEVKHTLDTLRKRGLLLAIGSSSKNARFILERLGIGDYFDAISDGNNITHSKPDPEVFIKAAGYLKVDNSSCLVVEDAKAGIEAAIAGGFTSAAISDAVLCNQADYNLETFSDLLEIPDLQR